MDILITGKLATFTSSFCSKIAVRHKVVMASTDINSKAIGNTANIFKLSPHDDDFEKLFNSYNFDTAIFCSQHPEIDDENFNEFDDLERFLKVCSDHDVMKVLYIVSNSIYHNPSEANAKVPTEGLGVMFSACEQLCDFYRKRRAMSVVTLKVPSLYGYGEEASLIGGAISEILTHAAYKFKGSEEQYCNFLSEKDLGELLGRMIDGWMTEPDVIELQGVSTFTFRQLGEIFKGYFPTVRITYEGMSYHVPSIAESEVPRKEYDWVAVDDLEADIQRLINLLRKTNKKVTYTFAENIKNFMRKHSFIIRLVELLVGFIIMELLNLATETTIQFKYVDFRLLYVLLMGTLHGIKTGLGAACLAVISLLIAYSTARIEWATILFNVETWLPFVCYLVMGTTTGYVKDRFRNDNKFLSDEKDVLEHKYISLNEFYVSALQNKDQYKNQIMSYRDSFGRMYDITKKLDSTLAESVFQEALRALEGVLENQSICIYSCDEHILFGRLNVCSKKIAGITEKSIVLSKLPNMVNEFADGEVWVNRDRLVEYPEYAAPIFRDGRPVAIIIIQKVKYEQFARYYENLIKVLCGLVKISLLRALEFTEKIEDEMYLPDTSIMVPSFFNRIINVKERMSEDGVSEHTVLRICSTPSKYNDDAIAVRKKLRTTDIIGLGDDNDLYVCLSQTNKSNVDIVITRLEQSGVKFEKIITEREKLA